MVGDANRPAAIRNRTAEIAHPWPWKYRCARRVWPSTSSSNVEAVSAGHTERAVPRPISHAPFETLYPPTVLHASHLKKTIGYFSLVMRTLAPHLGQAAARADSRRHEDDDAPQADLYEREAGGVTAQAEEHTEIRADYRHVDLPCRIGVAFAATRRLTRRRRCVARRAII